MDFVYIGAMALFGVAIWAMIAACDKLGGRS